MSLLDSRVIDKASAGELSGRFPKAPTGISAASVKNEKKNWLVAN
jgi:hypothetical protein